MSNEQIVSLTSAIPDTTAPTWSPPAQTSNTCALCELPVSVRPGGLSSHGVTGTFGDQRLTFCCYGCRYIYEVIEADLAQGVDVRQAMGRAGLDLNAPCCRGIIYGDPAEEAANTLARLMLNAFLAMMVMVLSLVLYSDFFFVDWGESGQGLRSMLQVTMLLFATPSVLLLAVPILEDAVFTFQLSRRLTTSALIAIGSLAAYGLSIYATFTGEGHTYFETATMTLLLVTVGRWLDARTQVEGNEALDRLLARTPGEANRVGPDGQETPTPVDQLRPGDRVRVRPGEHFAVDGRVVSGEGSVDEASITGEAEPAYKGPGQTVYAGTINLNGSFIVEATQVGEERVLGKLVRLLEEARLQRAPIERLADRVAAVFAPTIILLALSSMVYWTWQVSFEQGLLIGLAVLLIACPCALGVATPLTIWAALGRAAQQGVLIRDSLTLEKLSHVRRIFFDKTGTLTTGEARLVEMVGSGIWDVRYGRKDEAGEACLERSRRVGDGALEDWPEGSQTGGGERLLQIAASLEHGSEHPLGRSILVAAEARGLRRLPVERFQARPGLGVSGQIDGQQMFVGSWRLIEQQGLVLPEALQQERARLAAAGLTVVHVAWAGRVQGLLGLAETIRSTAALALAEMKRRGLTAQVLTGDSTAAGAALGRQLEVAVQSELLPHDKVRAIEAAEANGPVAMVGDGLNDAPALTRASIGLALGCGADVTREAADVSLLGNDLNQVSWTLALARRTYRVIGWNLAWAFAYNVIGVGLAVAGLLHPVLAAAAMVISSALVVGNSLRIYRF